MSGVKKTTVAAMRPMPQAGVNLFRTKSDKAAVKACAHVSPRDRYDNKRTYSNGGIDVLGKDDTLSFNDEKVDELLDVLGSTLEVLAWDDVVLSWTHLSSQAAVEHESTNDFGGSDDYRLSVYTHFDGVSPLTAKDDIGAL